MSLTLTLSLSASFPQFRSSRYSTNYSASLIPRATANMINGASARSTNIVRKLVVVMQWPSEETRRRIAKMFDKNKNEVSISSYDTAWVAMVPSPSSSKEPRFRDSVNWLLENQCSDGSWARPHHHSHSLLKKDVLSSTLACIIALHKWEASHDHVQKGLQFIEENIGCASDETQITPVGFNIVFPALLDYARDSSLNLRIEASALNHLMKQRDLELQRCNESSGDETEAYFAYIGEGMGKSHNWESSITKYQRKNGSLFNSPSTTAAAYIALRNSDCLTYIESILQKFGNGVPAVYPLNIYYELSIVNNLQSLGISLHFSREIQTALNRIYECWVQGDEEIFKDAITRALAFRMLRLNGYSVTSSEAVTKIVSSTSFPAGNRGDICTALELYKLTLYPEETDLDEEYLRLGFLLHKEFDPLELNAKVERALKYRLYANFERLATRENIEQFELYSPIILKTSYCWPKFSREELVSLAVEDYNRCQEIHRQEFIEFERWCKESRFEELLKQKSSYYFAATTMFAPEVADARMSWAKHAVLVSLVDDLSDANGSNYLEELTNLIDHLVQLRWNEDVSSSAESSSLKVQDIFSALKSIICETAEIGSKLQERSIKDHIILIWLDYLNAKKKEAEWRVSKYVPGFDEYLKNARVSIGLGPIVLPTLYLVGPKITQEMIRHSEYRSLFEMMSISGRLQIDILRFEKELEKGKLDTLSLSVYSNMNINNGGGDQATILEMQTRILTQRRGLHKLVFEDTTVLPKPCKELFWHMNSVNYLVYYKDVDGDWRTELLQIAERLIHQPILLDHQI